MSIPKQTLARYIEAYASARASGNSDLQAFAANQLSTFIQSVDITPEPTTEEEAGTTGDTTEDYEG